MLTIDNIWNTDNHTERGTEHLKKTTLKKRSQPNFDNQAKHSVAGRFPIQGGSFYLPPKALDFFQRINKAMASRTTTGITSRVVMRTAGTPEPGSLTSFCFSCIFCNSEEAGLLSILVSTTASDSSGKEELTIFNWLKDSVTVPPDPAPSD